MPFRRVSKQVVRIPRCCQPSPAESESYAARVDGDPATAPLFGDKCRCSATACWIEDEVPRVSGHEHASLDHLGICLHDIDLLLGELPRARVGPDVRERAIPEVIGEADIPDAVRRYVNA